MGGDLIPVNPGVLGWVHGERYRYQSILLMITSHCPLGRSLLRIRLFATLFLLLLLGSTGGVLAGSTIRPTDLRCEFRKDPAGIDAEQPRLSWVLESSSPSARGLVQTRFQVVVASTLGRLRADQGDLWDSGEVASDQSVHVVYTGGRLSSGMECFWKVRVWDGAGKVSGWSPTAKWTMGLLAVSDWRGQWIGWDEAEKPSVMSGGQWIWFPEGKPEASAPPATRWFRFGFDLPAGRKVKSARALMTADNEFALFVNGKQTGTGSNFRAATAMDIAGSLIVGRNVLAASAKNVGPNDNPAGLVGLVRIEFEEGTPLVLSTDANWRSSNREERGWETPGFADSGWVAAKVLGPVGMGPWGEVGGAQDRRLPARWLRKEFEVAKGKQVRRATAYISGLGLSELYLNGKKAGDDVLSPALSEYTKRAYYVTHDVTSLVRSRVNGVGVVLGNGRYYAPRVDSPTSTRTYGFPKVLMQLEVEYNDGTKDTVVTDGGWKLSSEGPILANCEYDGEEYDSRLEFGRWSEPGYDDHTWRAPQIVAAPGGKLAAQMMQPIRVKETLKPISVKEAKPGVFIYDMGQNLVGWCRIQVKGAAGTKVTLRHAETLRPDGTLYLDNIRGAKVTDVYTLKGQGMEVWEPRFTYHGFRFVEVTGWPGHPSLRSIEGRVVHDDVVPAGEFSCANPLLNQILSNVVWGVKGNYRSIPTDCPQRDERQGWLGDRSAECRGETYLFDISTLYAKWTQDMADAQKDNGSVSDVCPPYWPLYNDNVTWPSSTVIIPGTLLDQYGDVEVIRRHYPSMKLWMDHMAGFVADDVMPRDTYGDWCVPPENPKLIHSEDPMRKTHPTILGTAYFHYCLTLMQRYAALLNKPEDARQFGVLAERLKAGMNRKFLKADAGQYDNGSQTSCVLPLSFGLVPEGSRQAVFNRLVNKIVGETQSHVGTGLIGGQWLMRTLSDNGRVDLAYRLASNRDYPSWGYMVEKGATTIWELWNGDTADPAMNSGNHVMLVGDLVTWAYEYLAGIRPDASAPGFKRIVLKPYIVTGLDWVRASHRTIHGDITSEWRRTADGLNWKVRIPANTTARVVVPADDASLVREGGKALAQAKGLKLVESGAGQITLEAGSGTYEFTVRTRLP